MQTAQVVVNDSLGYSGKQFNKGDRIELPLETAKHLESVKLDPSKSDSLGVVTILSTNVDTSETDETAPNPTTSQDSGAKKKKTTKTEEEAPTGDTQG